MVCPACPWKPGSPQFAAANRGIRRSRVGEGQPYTFTAQRYTYPYTKTPGNAVYAYVNEVEVDDARDPKPPSPPCGARPPLQPRTVDRGLDRGDFLLHSQGKP